MLPSKKFSRRIDLANGRIRPAADKKQSGLADES
jgi:hypothetical protein